MKEKKIRVFLFTFIPFLLICLTFGKLMEREYKIWEEILKFQDGSFIKINHHFSKRKYYGVGHGFGIGGGYPQHKIWFRYKGVDCIWKGEFIPILLNVHQNSIYLVVFDRKTDWKKLRFHFYKFSKKWIELSEQEFPKSIAIQNMWLKENNGYYKGKILNEYQITEELDPSFPPFRESLTAKLWLQLEKGVKYNESPDLVDKDFLIKYKQKYIKKKENHVQNNKDENAGSIEKIEKTILRGTTNAYKKVYRNDIEDERNKKKTILNVFLQPSIFIIFLILLRLIITKTILMRIESEKRSFCKKAVTYIIVIIIISYIYLKFFNAFAVLLAVAGLNRL